MPNDRNGVNHDEKDGEEFKPDSGQHRDIQRVEVADNPSQTDGSKNSLVAEPTPAYEPRATVNHHVPASGITPSDHFRNRLKL